MTASSDRAESAGGLSSRGYVLALLALPVLLLLFHWPWVILDRPPNGADTLIFFPLVEEYRRWMASGHLPLWSDSIFCGQPIALQSEPALLNPLRLILLAFAGTHGEGLWLYLHALIAGLGMLAYCRAIGGGRMGALLAAYAAALGGPFAVHVSHPSIYAATAWIPLELLCVERLLGGGRALAWTAGLAVVSGLQWISGHAQLPMLTAYFLGLYTVLRAWVFRETQMEGRSLRAMALVALALFLGLGLAAFQIVPLVEVLGQTNRASWLPFDASAYGSLPPWGLLLPVFPAFYGTEGASDPSKFWLAVSGADVGSWELHWYAGSLCALLAIFALVVAARTSLVRTHLVLIAVGVLFALGRFTPVYRLAMYLPGVGYSRVPARAIAFLFFSMLTLACLGWRELQDDDGRLLRIWQRISLAVLLVMVAMASTASVALRLGEPKLTDVLMRRAEQKYSAEAPESGDVHDHARARALEIEGQLRTAMSPVSLATATNLAFLALAGWLVARRSAAPWVSKARWSVLLLLVLVADLTWFRGEFGTRPANDPAPRAAPPYFETIDRTRRVLSLIDTDDLPLGTRWDEYRELLPPNLGAAWGIDSPDGTTTTGPVEFRALFTQVHRNSEGGAERLLTATRLLGRLRVAGVGYVLTRPGWGALPWPLVYEDARVRLWQVPDALPRASLVSLADLDAPRWRDAFTAAMPSPQSAALLDSLRTAAVGVVRPLPSADPDEASFAIETPTASTLFRSTRFFPGWRADVDGVPVDIRPAVGFFQGVAVLPGSHVVRFQYRPRSLRVGAAVSTLAAVLLVTLGFLGFRPRGRRG